MSWEIRAATGLAQLWSAQSRYDDAQRLLIPIRDRFSEGFDSVDLRLAGRVLAEVERHCV
ncbi:MAG: hypothetical protein WDN69_37920 [Aliidongia sp.]